MIRIGDAVKYIGNSSPAYIGKTGKVIADTYQLPTVINQWFVDVVWDGESETKDGLLKRQHGHVVNVKNLNYLK